MHSLNSEIKDALNGSVCWMFFPLYLNRDAATVILHPNFRGLVFFPETSRIQRDWFQASLEFTAVLTVVTLITEEDKRFS